MKNNLLTKEIIRHIFGCCGIVQTSNVGLLNSELMTKKTIRSLYDDGEELLHKTFAGQISLAEAKLRAFVIDFSYGEDPAEYCLMFRMDQLPIHGLRISNDDSDFGTFRILSNKNVWTDASVEIQAMALVGIDKIASYGLLWTPCDMFDDLYKAAIILAGT